MERPSDFDLAELEGERKGYGVRVGVTKLFLAIALSACFAGVALASEPVIAKRQPPKTPPIVAAEPLYGIFVFGTNSSRPVWAVLDQSAKTSEHFDVLYLDVNGDGDLTAKGERFVAKTKMADSGKETNAVFEFPIIHEPGTRRMHTDFKVTWRPSRVSANIKWLGKKQMNAGYGTEVTTYGKFASTPEKAPVYVLGHELPFQFQHWLSGTLSRGGETDFKVFMGNLGEGQGAFCAVDNEFLPKNDYVVATVIYRTEDGAEKQEKFDLKKRC